MRSFVVSITVLVYDVITVKKVFNLAYIIKGIVIGCLDLLGTSKRWMKRVSAKLQPSGNAFVDGDSDISYFCSGVYNNLKDYVSICCQYDDYWYD